MDRDNPFSGPYSRDSVARVQKPRLAYRQSESPMPVPIMKRSSPHLTLQRRSSISSDVSAASNKPAIADDSEQEDTVTASNSTATTGPRSGLSVRPGSAARQSHRNNGPSRIARPTDSSRATVRFLPTTGRPEIFFTPPPGLPELPMAPTGTALSSVRPAKRNSALAFANLEAASFLPNPYRHEMPSRLMMPTASFGPIHIPGHGDLAYLNGNGNYYAASFGQRQHQQQQQQLQLYPQHQQQQRAGAYASGHRNVAESVSSDGHSNTANTVNTTRKTVTFDSSETEDSSSCLSTSTRATSVDDTLDYDYTPPFPKKTTAAAAAGPPSAVSTSPKTAFSSAAMQAPLRRRSRSFSDLTDRQRLRDEADVVRPPRPRRFSVSFAPPPTIRKGAFAPEKRQLLPIEQDEHDSASSTASSAHSAELEHTAHEDQNSRAEFEARHVALEAQFEQRLERALETKHAALAGELRAAKADLTAAQAERDALRNENGEFADKLQRMSSLEHENNDIRADLDNQRQARNGLEHDLNQLRHLHETQLHTGDQLRSELTLTAAQLSDATHALADAKGALTEADKAMAELRLALAEQEAKTALFREGKEAFEARCTGLEEKCAGLEGRCKDLEAQVKAARNAETELHVLMATQIDDLERTKVALKSHIETLEQDAAEKEAAFDAVTASNAQLKSESAEAAADLATLREEKAAADEAAESLKAEQAQLRGQCASLEEERASAEDARGALLAETDALVSKTTELEAQAAGLQDRLEGAKADLAAKVAEVAALQDENTHLKEAVYSHDAAMEKEREEAYSTAARLEMCIATLEEEKAVFAADLERLKDANINNNNSNSNASEVAAAHEELKDKQERLSQEYDGLQAQHAALAAKHAALISQHAQVCESRATLEGRVASLEEMLANAASSSTEAIAAAAAASSVTDDLRDAYATSEAEVMALRDQLAKMRARLAGTASSTATRSTSSSKKSKKAKDELVVVRNPSDRGRFQIVKKSELYNSRSPSRCSRGSRKSDYDSA